MPRSGRARSLVAVAAAVLLLAPVAWMWWTSLLPDTYDVAEMGYADYGGGPRAGHDHHGGGVPVADLVEERRGPPDEEATLTVRTDGDRYTVNGTSPGPELRVTQGDLVEVTLVNEDVDEGTTLHWHGIDVPNAMDGVAGVTQDAVMPGDSFTYRFVPVRAGTYWYHAHQVSHEQVRRGVLGAVVVEPRKSRAAPIDPVAVLHRYGSTPTLNGREGRQEVDVQPGDEVRVRVVNTDNALMPIWVTGAPYRVLAVDGVDVHEPGEVSGVAVKLTAGARVDLGVVVPDGGARVDFGATTALVLGEDPGGDARAPREFVDFLSYGTPADPGVDLTRPDREFDYRIGRRPGFLDGRPGVWWTVNGHLFPDIPMYMVDEGDVAVFHIENESGESHPMHLHGHHALVLSRDGEPATGSPWWIDSLEVGTGETFDIALVADNPGIWMDHCHNLQHAAEGLVAHLMYSGVSSSFKVGDDTDNHPE
ncbi:MAG: multicopper oxidase family protein [Nocardioides sp.]